MASGPLDRTTAVALLQKADLFLGGGDFGEAAAVYQRVIGFDDPAITGAALLGLGEALFRLDQEAAALQAWESVLKLPESPATYQAWRQVAAARVRDGDLRGAITAYREADRRAPASDKPEIASRLGWLAKETGDRRTAGRYFARSRGDGPPVSALMAILVSTIAISFVAMSGGGEPIFTALQLDKVAVAAGEWWRLLSVTLLHAGLLHLGFNMYALYLTGPIVERQYGSRWFVLLYLLCAAGGSVATYAVGDGRLAVGASGAIFGLFGVLIAATRTHRPVLDRNARMIIPQLGSIVLINLVLGFVIPGIDNLAHLGGLVTGLWLGFIIKPGQVRTLAGMWEQTGPAGGQADGGDGRRWLIQSIGLGLLVAVLLAGLSVGTARWKTASPGSASIEPAIVRGAPAHIMEQTVASPSSTA
jgi:membrane associated rhomboid family serine protease